MKYVILLLSVLALQSCNGQKKQSKEVSSKLKVVKTDAQWREELTPEQYYILREKGTERAHTGEYVNNFENGKYVCAGCGNVLFGSNSKFASDCGWPSFDKAIKGSVIYQEDFTLGMQRTEVMCASCGGHLGHVFDDGPIATTGKRYCTNSVAVKFIPAKKK